MLHSTQRFPDTAKVVPSYSAVFRLHYAEHCKKKNITKTKPFALIYFHFNEIM